MLNERLSSNNSNIEVHTAEIPTYEEVTRSIKKIITLQAAMVYRRVSDTRSRGTIQIYPPDNSRHLARRTNITRMESRCYHTNSQKETKSNVLTNGERRSLIPPAKSLQISCWKEQKHTKKK